MKLLNQAKKFPLLKNTPNAVFSSKITKQTKKHFSCASCSNWDSKPKNQTYSYSSSATAKNEILKFNPEIQLEEAITPPSSWYLSKEIFELESQKVFKRNWIGLCGDYQLQQNGNYFTGEIVNQPFVIVNSPSLTDEQNEKAEKTNFFKAFYNVCSHHAAEVASGSGTCQEFVCPYHGWTYNLNGNLIKSTAMKGIRNFRPKNYGLKPIGLESIGKILFLNFNKNNSNYSNNSKNSENSNENLNPQSENKSSPELNSNSNLNLNNNKNLSFQELTKPFTTQLQNFDFDPSFEDVKFVARKEYKINCNWKVFIDNYCDGGYHVPFAHKSLSSSLDLSTYKIEVFEKNKISIQSTKSKNTKNDFRLGGGAVYAFIYPNTMFNRYGPWLDINVVVPISETECKVIIEWYVNKELSEDLKFVEESLKMSALVQAEDVFLCETVMKGLKSDAYDVGRYVPSKELPAHHFHKLLYKDLMLDD